MLDQKLVDRPAPVEGKTYSLFGNDDNTTQYYRLISKIADAYLKQHPDIRELISAIQKSGKKNRTFDLKDKLSVYTKAVEAHLRGLSIFRLRDDIIGTTEEEYHRYMLEIELVNRAFKKSFKTSDVKLAFLPHCLHDLDRNCLSRVEPGDIDYTCRRCSKKCYINHVSALLKEHDIKPYIWMEAELGDVFKDVLATGASLGVLGIACIPELVNGMRLCMRSNIPVVGIPLNANRCRRWTGKFHPTSVNLEELERLVS